MSHLFFRPSKVKLSFRHQKYSVLAGILAMTVFLLSGCTRSSPEETFPAPNYDYLPRLNLSVARLSVHDQTITQQDNKSLIAQDPVSPVGALSLMARQRLHPTQIPAGSNTGSGAFIITQADMTSADEDQTLTGNFSVQLHLDDPSQNHHGQITAHVSRTSSFNRATSLRHHLYALTQSLMDDMNVELEYQIRKNLADWLTDASGAPLDSTVQSQNLSSDTTSPDIASPEATTSPAAISTTTRTATTTNPTLSEQKLHSPPPSVLHLPTPNRP